MTYLNFFKQTHAEALAAHQAAENAVRAAAGQVLDKDGDGDDDLDDDGDDDFDDDGKSDLAGQVPFLETDHQDDLGLDMIIILMMTTTMILMMTFLSILSFWFLRLHRLSVTMLHWPPMLKLSDRF